MPARVLLGSTSIYRAELLRRICADFEQLGPGTDETPRLGEAPPDRALRLAIAKAHGAAGDRTDVLSIGSDQVATLDQQVLDKPGSAERARAQLAASAGREVHFHTALCLLDTRTGREHVHVDVTRVRFRALDAATIARYVEREQPLACAGSFKCEGLGISLFERVDSADPTALIGLPLIALARMLRACGLQLP